MNGFLSMAAALWLLAAAGTGLAAGAASAPSDSGEVGRCVGVVIEYARAVAPLVAAGRPLPAGDLERRLAEAGLRPDSPDLLWFSDTVRAVIAPYPDPPGKARALARSTGLSEPVALDIVLYYEHTGRLVASPAELPPPPPPSAPPAVVRAAGIEPRDTWTRTLRGESPVHAEITGAFGSRGMPRWATTDPPPPEVLALLAVARAHGSDPAQWRPVLRRAELLRLNVDPQERHPNRVQAWLTRNQESLYGLYGALNEVTLLTPLLPPGARVIPGAEIRVSDRYLSDGWQYRLERPEGGSPRLVIDRMFEVKSSHHGLADSINQASHSISRLLVEADAISVFGEAVPESAIFFKTRHGELSLSEIRRRWGATLILRDGRGEPTEEYQRVFRDVFGDDFYWIVVPKGQVVPLEQRRIGSIHESPITRTEAIERFSDFLKRHVNSGLIDAGDLRATLFRGGSHVPSVGTAFRASPLSDAPPELPPGSAPSVSDVVRYLVLGFPEARQPEITALLTRPPAMPLGAYEGEHPISYRVRTLAARWNEVFPEMTEEAETAILSALSAGDSIRRSIVIEALYSRTALSDRLRAAVLRATGDPSAYTFRVARIIAEREGFIHDPRYGATGRMDALVEQLRVELAKDAPSAAALARDLGDLSSYALGDTRYPATVMRPETVDRLAGTGPVPAAIRPLLLRLATEGDNARARAILVRPENRDAAVDAALVTNAFRHQNYSLSYWAAQPGLVAAQQALLDELVVLTPPPAGLAGGLREILSVLPSQRDHAAAHLVRLNPSEPGERERLVELLDHGTRPVREIGIRVVASLRPPPAGLEARLVPFLADRQRSSRNAAVQALEQLPTLAPETRAQIEQLRSSGRIDSVP